MSLPLSPRPPKPCEMQASGYLSGRSGLGVGKERDESIENKFSIINLGGVSRNISCLLFSHFGPVVKRRGVCSSAGRECSAASCAQRDLIS